jgi:hypothetical protein
VARIGWGRKGEGEAGLMTPQDLGLTDSVVRLIRLISPSAGTPDGQC